jgi:transcriptional regulator with XRE-family HTH domain
MTTEQEARRLKRAMGERGRGRSIPADVQEAALRYVRRRREEGASQQVIADELGISQHTVSRWLRGVGSKSKSTLVPVEIDYGAPNRRSEIVVTTPRGLRVEGLDVDTLCVIVARVG